MIFTLISFTFVLILFSIAGVVAIKHILKFRPKGVRKKTVTTSKNLPFGTQEYLLFLRRTAKKISEDQKHLQLSFSPMYSSLKERRLQEMMSSILSAQETMCAALIHQNTVQKQSDEEILKTLDTLKFDFKALQAQMAPTMSLAIVTQAEREGVRDQEVNVVVLNSIMLASKECFEKLVSESKSKGKEIIQDITRFLEQSRKEIKRELMIFSSVVAAREKEDKADSNLSVITEFEKVEKILLETFIFLNRQRFEMENFYKTLKYFDVKFVHFSSKIDTFSEQIKARNSNATSRLQKTEELWSSTTKMIDMNSRCLIHQARIFKNLVCEMQNNLECPQAPRVVSGLTQLAAKADGSLDGSKEHLHGKIKDYNQLLKRCWSVSKHVREKLSSLSQAANNLESLEELVKSTALGYEALLQSLLHVDARSCLLHRTPTTGSTNIPCVSKDNADVASNSDIQKELVEGKTPKAWSRILNEGCPDTVNLETILPVLNNVVKMTWELAEHDKLGFHSCEILKQHSDPPENIKAQSDLESNPSSESLLKDVSSDCLVQNSDESDSGSAVD